MRCFIIAVFLSVSAVAAQSATYTYEFMGVQNSVSADEPVSGIVDAVRGRATITGRVIFDLSVVFADANETVYAPATIEIDGVDLTAANARAVSAFARVSATGHQIGTGYLGFFPGAPEIGQVLTFNIFDGSNTLLAGGPVLPVPIPGGYVGRLGLQSVVWDGVDFVENESAAYEIRLRETTPAVPLPAGSVLLASALVAFGAARRRKRLS